MTPLSEIIWTDVAWISAFLLMVLGLSLIAASGIWRISFWTVDIPNEWRYIKSRRAARKHTGRHRA